MSSNIEIIDAHIHLWDPISTPRSVSTVVKLFGRFPKLLNYLVRVGTRQDIVDFFVSVEGFVDPHLPEVYQSRTGHYNVRGCVHIQADWQIKDPIGLANETAWLDQLSDPPLAIIGEARVSDQANFARLLDAHLNASSRFRGVRDMLANHPAPGVHDFNQSADVMGSDAFRQGYALLGERDLSFDAFIYSHQIDDLCEVIASNMDTRIVIDHVATPVGVMGPFCGVGQTEAERKEIQSKWYAGLAKLAAFPHVHIKLSGLMMPAVGWQYKTWTQPLSTQEVVDAIGPHIRYTIEQFGVDRCMFASNFPPDRALVDFVTYYDAYFKIVEGFSAEDQQKLFRDNAASFYRI